MKYKDALPEETVKRLEQIFQSLNISLGIILKKRLDKVYSSIIYDASNWWSTGGKGTTEDYCLASGYAEAIEHLCNYCGYQYRLVNEEARLFGGFLRYPDEMRVPILDAIHMNEAVFEDIRKSYSDDGTSFSDEQCAQGWAELLNSTDATVVPFFSFKNNRTVFLPDEIISRLSGSTGGGAGNTPYEALVHAFDEICERYAKYQIYMNQLTPPEIPMEYIIENCPDLYETICHIQSKGYRVLVKDASLGKQLPVISVALIDPASQSYMIKFGAHLSFPIALERCLTEMFQSYSLDSNDSNGHKAFHHWCKTDGLDARLEGTWFNQLKDDTGAVPFQYFLSQPSWRFEPWGIGLDFSNRAGVQFHLDNFNKLGCTDIFIRDLNFLGFPVYKVYIPGFSNSHLSMNRKVIHDFFIVNDVIDGIIKGQIDDVSKQRAVLIECFSKKSYIGEMLLKNIEDRLISVCHAALLYEETGDLSALQRISESNQYARSIIFEFDLVDMGYVKEERIKLFETMTDDRTQAVVACWREKYIFSSLVRCLIKSISVESNAIAWDKFDSIRLSRTHIDVKKMMMRNTPDQTAIEELINSCFTSSATE